MSLCTIISSIREKILLFFKNIIQKRVIIYILGRFLHNSLFFIITYKKELFIMSTEQMGMFTGNYSSKDKISTIHIVYENKRVNMSIEEIFDSRKYDIFTGVTYSITPEFMNKYLSNFNHSQIVVGIFDEKSKFEANQMAKNIQSQFSRDISLEAVNLFQGLSTNIKNKLDKKIMEVKVPTSYVIHSKFYLMENDDGDNRIVIGSANLSNQAFSDKVPQFENIIILDNNSLYGLYKDYFNDEIKPILSEYFPKELLKINAREIKKITKEEEVNIDKVFALTNDDVERIRSKAPLDTIDNLREKVAIGLVPKTVYNEMKNIDSDKGNIDSAEKEKSEIKNIAYELIKESINPRLKKPNLKKTIDVPKFVRRKIQIISSSKQDESLVRKELYSKSGERNLDSNKTGLFIPMKSDKNSLQMFGEIASDDEIKKSLEVLNQFMETYSDFVYKYEDGYGQRIMEAVIYVFSSPFIYELKQMLELPESRLDIPQFLFIGGTAGSGKSSLLKVLTKMVGVDDKPYWRFDSLYEGHNDKSNKVNILRNWMTEENVNPIMVDEINPWFFTNNHYGTDLIKTIANNNVNNVNAFPVLIGTTNSDGYSLPAEGRRRSYFLKIDKIFDSDHKKDSQIVYQDIYNKIDNKLFLDFVYRMSKRIENKDIYNWNHFSESCGLIDFLYQSREIFKEYYKESNIPLPRYFPMDRYSDDSESAQEKWRKLYKSSSKIHFTFDENSYHLFFKLSTIDENSFQIYGGKKLSQIYADSIPQKILIGSSQGVTDIELDTDKFFEWIGESNPYKDYYKKKLLDTYLEDKSKIEESKAEIIIDLEKLTDDESLRKRIYEAIPSSVINETDEQTVHLNKVEFCKWQNIPYKNSLFNRVFGNSKK